MSKKKHGCTHFKKIYILTIIFSTLFIACASCVLFFLSKMPLRFSDFENRTEFFLCYVGEKKKSFSSFGFYNLKTSKNRLRSFFFSSDYRIRTKPPFSGEKSFDYIIRIISVQILSLFVTWITSLRTKLIFLTPIFLF